MRGGRSDRSSESGVLGVFEPDRLLAIVGGEVLRGGSSSMIVMCECSCCTFGSRGVRLQVFV
jgi:hypothetical protein